MRELQWEVCYEPFDEEYRKQHFIRVSSDPFGEIYFDDNNKPLTFYMFDEDTAEWCKALAHLAQPEEEDT